jgi:hypothetical protein
VPEELVTVTSSVPVPGGLTAVIEVAELTVKLVAGTDPKSTEVTPVKSAPDTVTEVPPAAEPAAGARESTAGIGK